MRRHNCAIVVVAGLAVCLQPCWSFAQSAAVVASVNAGVACLGADSRWCERGAHPVIGGAAGVVLADSVALDVVSEFTFTSIDEFSGSSMPRAAADPRESWSFWLLASRSAYLLRIAARTQLLLGGTVGGVRERYSAPDAQATSWRFHIGGDVGVRYRISPRVFAEGALHVSPLTTARIPLLATASAGLIW